MRRIAALGILSILAVAMSFGIMVGYTTNGSGYGALSVGAELNSSTFAYGGLSFPLGLAAGGGMKIGNLFEKNLGKTSQGKNIGDIKVSWGGVANANVDFWYVTNISVFGGPALFFDWNSDFIEGNLFWYAAVGASFDTLSGLSLEGSSGLFYKF